MDKGGGREGRGAWRHIAGTPHIKPHAASQQRPSPFDARDTDQLPVTLAGTLVDPDDMIYMELVPDPTGSLMAVP